MLTTVKYKQKRNFFFKLNYPHISNNYFDDDKQIFSWKNYCKLNAKLSSTQKKTTLIAVAVAVVAAAAAKTTTTTIKEAKNLNYN